MSIYSPTVLPTSGRSLAQALGQGVNTYLATRDRKRQQDIEDEMRARSESVQNAQLGEQGIHLTKPGELPPTFDVNVSGGPNPDDLTSAAIGRQPTPMGQPLAAALSRHLTSGPGYYIDRDEQAQHYQQQTGVAQAQALAKALGEGTAQNILDPYAREDKHAVAQSTVAKNTADATRPRAPLPGTPAWEQAEIKRAQIQAQYGYHPDPQPLVISAVDPKTGESHFYRVPKAGGDAQEVGGLAPKPTATSGGELSGTGQGIQARLLGAIAEARAASQRMDAYENKMLANPSKATPSVATQIGGKLATRLAGSHALSGIVGETLGEATTDPEYLQYVRDAGLMARATQLMSSRGGSEAMVSAEQLLNRAVPNAAGLAGSVAAARKSRNAIFGKTGGLMQALTPEQIAKVEAGLDALEHGESNSPALREAGQIIAGAQAAPQAAPRHPSSGNVDLRKSPQPASSQGKKKTYTFGGVTYEVPE